ncbi:MAG: transglutaminaseTgpA domain-containing protein [Longimicrobiales bacterium]|nr:transglutaminaseTgpA domain-containing protein [Longimicrobiales bacterium]
MNLRLLHRRLAVLMAFSGLLAFAGGAGVEPIAALLAAGALTLALVWHPSRELSARMERVWLPIATLLVGRALLHAFVIRDDIVIPVVDLLMLLMAAEALRALDAPNDIRLYALSFALLLAATAYRPGIVFLVAFVAFVGLATLGLMVGHLRRQAERHGVREIPLGRWMVWTTTGLTGVILLVAAAVFVTFPRISRGWAGRGETLATSIAGFSDQVSLAEHGSRIYGNPQIVLRVEFPGGLPANFAGLHWRGRSYDRFDGVRWARSRSLPPSAGPSQWYRERWTAPRVEQRIWAAPLDVRVLFTLHPVVAAESENGIQPLFDNAGDFLYWGSGPPAYTVWSPGDSPTAVDLRAVERGYLPSARHFLQLPELDPRIPALADSLTAGLPTRYDKAAAIQRHLRSFRYTLELPATASETGLEHFLFQRRAGHCEYFSTAMVVLLRASGIEARNVNGFLGGEWNEFGSYLAVTQNQAHSWVEVWFPEYGWVTFDPTPGGGGAGERLEAWFWPGRIFFDGIQHRWNKWVLDYNIESQSGIFQRWSDLLGSPRVEEAVARAAGDRGRTFWGPALLALLIAAGIWWVGRGRRTLPREVRIYLQLRASCERAGVAVAPGLTPLALVARVREAHESASGAAERVVDLYLRARYGGELLADAELREMTQALGAVRKSLRAKA